MKQSRKAKKDGDPQPRCRDHTIQSRMCPTNVPLQDTPSLLCFVYYFNHCYHLLWAKAFSEEGEYIQASLDHPISFFGFVLYAHDHTTKKYPSPNMQSQYALWSSRSFVRFGPLSTLQCESVAITWPPLHEKKRPAVCVIVSVTLIRSPSCKCNHFSR